MNQPNTRQQAIVFDFGGVLIDWNPRHLYRKLFKGDARAMEHFLSSINFTEWNSQQDKGRPFEIAVAELTSEFPHYRDLIRAYDERWEETIGGPIQSTVDILETLKLAEYQLYGLSNWSQEKFQIVRAKYNFFNWFKTILVSGEARLAKPDPQIYTLLLERIGRKAEECLFIDDSEANIETAMKLKFDTIHYKSSDQLEKELCRLGYLL